VIATDADVGARVETRAALANDVDSESRPFLLLPPAFLCAMVSYLR
jgi:hypothetical protein